MQSRSASGIPIQAPPITPVYTVIQYEELQEVLVHPISAIQFSVWASVASITVSSACSSSIAFDHLRQHLHVEGFGVRRINEGGSPIIIDLE